MRTIPVATEFCRFDVTPLPRVLRAKRGTTWLFVGRVSPNKGLEALIDAFEAYMALDDDSSLVILGKYDPKDPYYNALRKKIADAHIEPYVRFTGYARNEAIVGYYRTADVFVSMSEHEGFCVPLLEAMFFDVPIIAKATTAIPYTLGNAGLLIEPHADAFQVAAAVHEVCTNESLRLQIVAAQRERRRDFLPKRVNPLVDALAKDLLA
ncbi:MAG: glycosyltransferase [Vulcanimicrobiaceae bacterium]